MTDSATPTVPQLLADVQKALNALSAVDPAQLVTEVKSAVAAADTALALVDKFSILLPAQYRAPLQQLSAVLHAADVFVQKI